VIKIIATTIRYLLELCISTLLLVVCVDCSMDGETDRHSDKQIKAIYDLKNIAIVGMSKNPEKPSYFVPRYLIEHGYTVIPVNPTASTILERRSFEKVSDIEDKVDVVDVFRKSEDVYPVVQETIRKAGIRVIWLQEGIHNLKAEKLAIENGIDVVYNRCMMAEHMRLFPE
jgi:predicted CoA-binding protein